MSRPDLLSRVQHRGRLYGRNESRRVVRAVIDTLLDAVPLPLSRRLAMRVSTETGAGLPRSALSDDGPDGSGCDCRAFVAAAARRLFTDEPNAAFLARIVFGELNAARHGITPAALALSAAPDLRPLLRAEASVETARPPVVPVPDKLGVPTSAPPHPPVEAMAAARVSVARTVSLRIERVRAAPDPVARLTLPERAD
jgi:hypothetical protein